MKTVARSLTLAATAAALLPAAASAAEVQVGVTTSPLVAPTCPADAQGASCTIILEQVTAYETLRDGVANPDTVRRSGIISSFTLGLAGTKLITPAILAAEDQKYGGPPEAQLTALVPIGTPSHPSFRVAAQTTVVKLRSELGRVAEFPLITPLPVVRGEVLALTIPTWAPVLSIEQPTTKFAYAQSRTKQMIYSKPLKKSISSCNTTGTTNFAQVVVGQLSGYSCTYAGTRIEYSALEITTPSGFTGNVRRARARAARITR
ncbi:MAG TPA: hypothetical protein VFN36_03160 [Solirubrobacteraceae bacterium]|nr:hypothetical protein [Solirubrobacteraceae bacterium]